MVHDEKNKEKRALKAILKNNAAVNRLEVENLLVVYDINRFFIGDTLQSLSKLRLLARYFPAAAITINASHPAFADLLKNSPYLDRLTFETFDRIAFGEHDLVLCVSDNETELSRYILAHYRQRGMKTKKKFFVFSLYNLTYNEGNQTVFPFLTDLATYQFPPEELIRVAGKEVFLSPDEQQWADDWLLENGFLPDQHLSVLFDSASNPQKLLDPGEHLKLLAWLARCDNGRVLIFDENATGKQHYYEENTDADVYAKLIFAQGTSLRESMCLLGSSFTRLVIGPCSGMLHCASGIYNVSERSCPPLIVVYKCNFDHSDESDDPYLWWEHSRAECLLIRAGGELVWLAGLEDKIIPSRELGYCADLSAEAMIEAITARFGPRCVATLRTPA